MGLLKRAIASVTRRMGKTMMLLILVFILGSLIVGGVLVQRAVVSTEENLRRSMPPITAIEFDDEAWMKYVNETGERGEPSNISADVVRQIGDLPHVSHFNYSITSELFSFEIERYIPEIEGDVGDDGITGFPTFGGVTGVSRPEIIYIEQGLIELVAGRTFEENEMNVIADTIPIVMSQLLAEKNNLTLGSTFTLNAMLPNTLEHQGLEAWHVDNLLINEEYRFEVVGLFDMIDRQTDLSMANDEDFNEWNYQSATLNEVYIPAQVAEEINRSVFEAGIQAANELGFDASWFNPNAEFEPRIESMFVLEDSLEVDNFRAAVEPLIPDYYKVADLSNSFANMQSSMETMLWIADTVVIVAVATTVLILSLIIMLFLRDRRYEMGIYLALGEKKSKIISQILLEVVATALIGLTLAVFTGSIAASQISQSLLRNQLVAQVEPEERIMAFDGTRNLETLGFVVEMSPDEMMEAFDITLDAQSIALLYGLGITTVIMSTLIPVMYITRLNPKKILMEAKS